MFWGLSSDKPAVNNDFCEFLQTAGNRRRHPRMFYNPPARTCLKALTEDVMTVTSLRVLTANLDTSWSTQDPHLLYMFAMTLFATHLKFYYFLVVCHAQHRVVPLRTVLV